MKGFVTKKGDAWYVVLELDRQDGVRRPKWISVRKELGLSKPATKKQAQELLVKLLNDLRQGTYVQSQDITVAQLLKKWMDIYGPNLRTTTRGTYEAYIKNHIMPEIGQIKVQKLTAMHLEELYARKLTSGRADGRAGGLDASSVAVVHKILCRALKSAMTWEIVSRNVAELVTPPKSQPKTQRTWTADDTRQFLHHIAGHRLYPLYLLAITTGMRRGEVAGLRWQDIDWERRVISVVQAIVRTPAGDTIAPTKTAAGKRTIALSPLVLAALKGHRLRQAEELLTLGRPLSEMVFTTEVGTNINPNNLLRHFKTACKNAGVPVIPFHALRHTHATLLLQEGVHPKVVSERLGHSRVGVTLDVYSHVLPDMQREAADLFEQVVKSDRRLIEKATR